MPLIGKAQLLSNFTPGTFPSASLPYLGEIYLHPSYNKILFIADDYGIRVLCMNYSYAILLLIVVIT